MKISVHNFKSIRSVIGYDLKPLTILSGVNSSGKSSFIQLLLLLKQTIELDSSKYQFELDGEFYKVREFTDILRGKNIKNKLKIAFELDKSEFWNRKIKGSLFDSFPDYTCRLEVSFDSFQDEIYVSEFFLNYTLSEGEKRQQYIKFKHQLGSKNHFTVDSNSSYFAKGVWNSRSEITSISFSSIFPTSFESYSKEIIPAIKKNENVINKTRITEYTNVESIKTFIKAFFNDLSYVGPLRDTPKDEYIAKRRQNYVGISGENVAQILENFSNEAIELFLPKIAEDGITYKKKKTTLLKAVQFWICDVFKLGKKIFARKTSDSYSIILVNDANIETTIKHVGFGISQILPIIVEGLRMSHNGTLVLEQPEIHLHPKIQSYLFDFVNSLVLSGKHIIIETHSDHFITRMRRRIAEDETNTLKNRINLTFIESAKGEILFKNIDLDDFGTADYFPSDFIERTDLELNAIVKAQMKKRIKTNKKSV